jgi:hypothetical protein
LRRNPLARSRCRRALCEPSTDPDDYGAAIRAATIDLTVTERGAFDAKLVRIDLYRLWMQRFSENLARVVDAANLLSGRAYISFRTRPGPSLLQAGVEIQPSAILRHGKARDYYQRSSGSAFLGTMSLPIEDLATVGEVMCGCDLTPPRDAMSINPPPAAMARLQRLHAAAGNLAESAPEIIANPNAARGLEQALIEAMIGCFPRGIGRRRQVGTAPPFADHATVSSGSGRKPRSTSLHP